MKKLFVLLGLIAFTTLVFATPHGPPYNNKVRPKLPMLTAYEIALKQVVATTNQYYCVSANIITDFGPPAWSFRFCATNSGDNVIVVEFDGIAFPDTGFR